MHIVNRTRKQIIIDNNPLFIFNLLLSKSTTVMSFQRAVNTSFRVHFPPFLPDSNDTLAFRTHLSKPPPPPSPFNINLTRQATYVQRNIESRLCIQLCSGKAMSITQRA